MRRFLPHFAGVALLLGLLLAGYLTRGYWLPWLQTPAGESHSEPPVVTTGIARETVFLSPQAQKNLNLFSKPLKAETYWKTASIPGTVVDRPGHSDRGIVAPVAGVVSRIHRFTGDIVKPGEVLFTFKLLSEFLHTSQTELFKAAQEIKLAIEQKKRLAMSGAVPEARLIEIDNQITRMNVTITAYRQELRNRGLSSAQIDEVAEGKFVSEIPVVVPPPHTEAKGGTGFPVTLDYPHSEQETFFEIQELKVEIGQQVNAGQTLCLLANHQLLAFEGRAFQSELPGVEKALQEKWPIEIDFLEEMPSDWSPLEKGLAIRYLSNNIDPVSRTFSFFIPFDNPYRTLPSEKRTLILWRFRPGQRVKLNIRTEKIDDVFVLPREAVVREGAEAYVFRQNGDTFDRKPVHVILEDRRQILIANDGSVPPGIYVAQTGAVQLNRMLKSQSGQTPKGFHIHADGSVHMGEH